MTGGAFPCMVCGMSHRNTVHTNEKQFGYHKYVESPTEDVIPDGITSEITDTERALRAATCVGCANSLNTTSTGCHIDGHICTYNPGLLPLFQQGVAGAYAAAAKVADKWCVNYGGSMIGDKIRALTPADARQVQDTTAIEEAAYQEGWNDRHLSNLADNCKPLGALKRAIASAEARPHQGA